MDPAEGRRLVQDAEEFMKLLKVPEEIQEEEELSPLRMEVEKLSFGNFPSKKLDLKPELLSFTENFYNRYRKLPNKADFQQMFGSQLPQDEDGWEELMEYMAPRLEARGIAPYETPLNYLEPQFVAAVGLICNVLDKRSPAAKLKEVGLTTRQWKALLCLPQNQEYYRQCLNEIFNEQAQDIAKLNLVRAMEAGDLQAIKHFHEVQNIYRPQNNNNNELLAQMLQAIMEILAMHVNAEVLSKVASQLRSSEHLKAINVNAS